MGLVSKWETYRMAMGMGMGMGMGMAMGVIFICGTHERN
jgi:hypothetical protein